MTTQTRDPKHTFKVDECFLQSLVLYTVPANNNFNRSAVNTHYICFVNNTAKMAGSALYGGLIDRCSLNSQMELKNQYTERRWDSTHYILNLTEIDSQDVSSDPVSIVFCRNDQAGENYQPPVVYVENGQEFNVSVVAVDQVPEIVHSTLSLSSAGMAEGQLQQNTPKQCNNLLHVDNFDVMTIPATQ